jgi:hypothetical protein
MNHDSEAESRAKFEARYIYIHPLAFERNSNGAYASVRVQGAWEGWQAALMSRQAPPDLSQEGGKGDT